MKNYTLLILIFISSICKSETIPSNSYAGGQGTISSPYEIETLAQLRRLSETPEDWSSSFILIADIDAEDTETWNSTDDTIRGFSPIGDSDNGGDRQQITFTGNFDGNGHTISNLYINRISESNVGFFGRAYEGTISELGIKNCTIAGGNYTGTLIGSASTTIERCFGTGTVSGIDVCGGLVGFSSRLISNCYSSCIIYGTDDVGGLVGRNAGEIESSFASAKFSDPNLMTTGGFVGYTNMNITNCKYNGASISRPTAISFDANYPSITAITEQEMFEANKYGFDFDNIWLMATDEIGVYGIHFQWEYNLSVTNNVGYGGKTTGSGSYSDGESVTITAEPYPGFRFSGWTTEGSIISNDSVYSFTYSSGTPLLLTAQFESDYSFNGDGTESNPYQIATFEDLQVLCFNRELWGYNIYFLQTADIDASESSTLFQSKYGYLGFYPIGNRLPNLFNSDDFSAKYNGGGHTISNLYINRRGQNNCGLFGNTQNTYLENIHLINCDISGKENIGGIAGMYYGNVISNCSVSGKIEGNTDIQAFPAMPENTSCGGIAGYAYGNISDCIADVIVLARASTGGIVGEYQGGNIINCTAHGNITTEGYNERCAGGIAGYAYNVSFTDCISDCTVSTNSCGGGLIGYCKNSSVNNSSTSGTISCNYSGGGLIGRLYSDNNVSLSTSSAQVEIRNTDSEVENMGGFIGDITNGEVSIINCSSTGIVTGVDNTGGLIGLIDGDYNIISCSVSNGNVIGSYNTGGFIGELRYNNSGNISKCSANGIVTGSEYTGGFIGWNTGTISESYSLGMIYGNTASGGFAGYSSYGLISNCFSSSEINGGENSAGFVSDYRTTYFENVYSISKVSLGTNNYSFSSVSEDITDSYFDVDINPSMQGTPTATDQVLGINTNLFANSTTFANWNFDSIWTISTIPMIDSVPRPYFQWMINNYSDSLSQTITLNVGWNLISINRELDTSAIENVFASIHDNIIEIRQADLYYNAEQTDYLNTLTHIQPGLSYMILMSSNDNLRIEAEAILPDTTSVQLYVGWNMIGSPYMNSVEIEVALSSILDKIEVVRDLEDYYIPGDQTGDLTLLSSGQGYFIKVSEDCILNWE